MKMHKGRVIERPGYTRTTTLCGRMNRANPDGMNIAANDATVTCRFCLKQMETAARLRAAREARQ